MFQPLPDDCGVSEHCDAGVDYEGIVARAQAGDHLAFTTLFQVFSYPIWRYIARFINDDEAAKDLAQDTFVSAWLGLPKLPGQVKFRPWLYKIATNKVNDYYKHSKRHPVVRLPQDPYIDERVSLEEPKRQEQEEEGLIGAGPEELMCEMSLVQFALNQLQPTWQTCLLLKVEGFSLDEIAEATNLSASAVATILCRSRKQLRKSLNRLEGKKPGSAKGGVAE